MHIDCRFAVDIRFVSGVVILWSTGCVVVSFVDVHDDILSLDNTVISFSSLVIFDLIGSS